MKDKNKIVIFTSFWLVVATLIIFSLAGTVSPRTASSSNRQAKLLGPASGQVDKSLSLSLNLKNSSADLHASLSPDNGNRHAIIGSLELPGNLENVEIDLERKLAFLANSFSGVQIADISDATNIKLIGFIETTGNAWDLLIHENYLFIASALGGLQIVDISEPKNPAQVSELVLPATPLLKLALFKNTLYASSGKKGLQIIDLSNINSPKRLPRKNARKDVWGLKIINGYLYLSSSRFQLESYSLATPHKPQLIKTLSMPDRAWEMGYFNQHLYAPTRQGGLIVFDISTAGNPVPVVPQVQKDSVETISIDGMRALLTNRKSDLFIYDLSNPATPKKISTSDLASRPRNASLRGDIAYIASGLDGLQVIDINRLAPENQLQSLHLPGKLNQVLFDDSYYYLATRRKGLFVAKRQEDEQLPIIVASLPLPGFVQNMVRSGNHLFITCSFQGLQIVDISDPLHPHISGTFNYPGSLRDLAVNDRNLYIASENDGLLIVNTTFPDDPILLGHLPLPDPKSLVLKKNRAYIATTGGGLHIIDITNSSQPTEISRRPLPWPLQELARFQQLAIAEKTVYLAAGEAELIQFNIADENNPEITDIINIEGETLSVTNHEEKIYVATRQGRLWILKNKNGKLQRQGVADILSNCSDIKFQGEKIVLANGVKGLSFLSEPQNLTIKSRSKTGKGASGSSQVTIEVPPQNQPAVYNLALFDQGHFTEFVGAVRITDKEE